MLKPFTFTQALCFFLISQTLCVQAQTNPVVFPSRKEPWVNDFANVIDSGDKETIESLCGEIQNEGLATIVVCTMESIPQAKNEDEKVLSYGADLFDLWKLPKEGVLILISTKDRKTAICTGQLAQRLLPDSDAGKILRKYLLPKFKKRAYGRGCIAGITQARKTMLKNRQAESRDKNR
ncbi:MAG: TPM domain-containing protein [Thermodesulfobacteriota bacterium]|nr:TPM domain-containing protein [Thermodesulfobacteriota bacterium]